MMLYAKYESSGPCSFDKKIFESCIFKTYFRPCDLHLQPSETIWTMMEMMFKYKSWRTKDDGRRTTDNGRLRTTDKGRSQ